MHHKLAYLNSTETPKIGDFVQYEYTTHDIACDRGQQFATNVQKHIEYGKVVRLYPENKKKFEVECKNAKTGTRRISRCNLLMTVNGQTKLAQDEEFLEYLELKKEFSKFERYLELKKKFGF